MESLQREKGTLNSIMPHRTLVILSFFFNQLTGARVEYPAAIEGSFYCATKQDSVTYYYSTINNRYFIWKETHRKEVIKLDLSNFNSVCEPPPKEIRAMG